ncbi:MAG: FkbM family methyltransferase [Chloroflexota bacterium]
MQFDLGDAIQRSMYLSAYDLMETRLMRRILSRGDTFFDVGANVGYYSFVASQLVGETGRVHSFEPIGENASAIRQVVERNGLRNIVLNETAVGAAAGAITLYAAPWAKLGNSGGASRRPHGDRVQPVELPLVSLDDYVSRLEIGSVRLVKIDVEGMELEVLKGMNALLASPASPDLICEVWPEHAHAVIDCLSERSYAIYPLPFTKAVDPTSYSTTIVTNIFCTSAPGRFGSRAGAWARLKSYLE